MSECVYDPFERFLEALRHCDTVKVILTGCGESVFSTEEVYKSITSKFESREFENKVLHTQLISAIDDIYTAYSDGLCEVCGRRETCLMTLDRGEEGTVCHGIKFEWRGKEIN